MRSYGYVQSPVDNRDVIFKVESELPESYKLREVPGIFDQGNKPICAAISLTTIINWQEHIKSGKNVVNPDCVYKLRPNQMDGMIPRLALKSLKKDNGCGYKIKSFSRVEDVDSAKAAIQINGPLLTCFMAYSGDKFWEPSGQSEGGHAVVLTGWDKDGFVLQNSWGREWGSSGTMTLPFNDWRYVMEAWTIMI